MNINLLEIPDQGETFLLTSKDTEMAELLADLLAGQEFFAEVFIRPIQRPSYEIRGRIKTQSPEECSRCGLEFKYPIDESFAELLHPKTPLPRDGKYSRVNHFSDLTGEGPAIYEYEGHHLDLGEYLHEVIALAQPAIPAPSVQTDGTCSLCHENVQKMSFTYDEDFPALNKAFADLKNLRKN
jgi:uncharacterized protein